MIMNWKHEYNDAFTNHIRSFYFIHETRDYMQTRLKLADQIYALAVQAKPPQLNFWEPVIGHYQEMLRLCMSDNLGLCQKFPFLLLHVNRDDDAACFVVHWL
jgi:hypothetical protein